jgi:ABC-2 type transport system permease protein
VNLTKLMIWKEFAHIRADKLSVRLMVFPVIAQIFILGYALTTEVKNITFTAVDESNTPQSSALIEAVKHNPLFIYKPGPSATVADARKGLDNGDIKAALVIPHEFARELLTKEGARVQLLVDGQDANSANVARGYMGAIIGQYGMRHLRKTLEKQGVRVTSLIPVTVSPVVLFNPLLKSTWYMIPALVVLIVTIITALLSGLSIVKEKEAGTLEQLMVTPLEPRHVIVGKTVPYLLIGLIEICVSLVAVTLWFGIPFRGNVFLLLLFGALYMISTLGIGILTSTIARTPQQVLFLIWFILIFFIMLSGFFIPVENMPHWVRIVSCVNPVRFFMFAVREIFLKGSGLAELWREGLAMVAIGTTFLGASVALFHRRAK